MVALKLVHASGTEPGSEAVRIYAALGVLENLVPKVHRASQPLNAISTGVEMLWKSPSVTAVLFGAASQVRYYATRPRVVTAHENSRLKLRKTREAGFCLNETFVARENCTNDARSLHK